MATKQPDETKPWYGKTCLRCEAPINYAYAAKGPLPGYCGRCTDEVRRVLFSEAKAEIEKQAAGHPGRARPRGDAGGAGGRGGAIFIGLVVGVILGLAAAIVVGALAPERLTWWTEQARKLLGKA
jgi:hypothetical protein